MPLAITPLIRNLLQRSNNPVLLTFVDKEMIPVDMFLLCQSLFPETSLRELMQGSKFVFPKPKPVVSNLHEAKSLISNREYFLMTGVDLQPKFEQEFGFKEAMKLCNLILTTLIVFLVSFFGLSSYSPELRCFLSLSATFLVGFAEFYLLWNQLLGKT